MNTTSADGSSSNAVLLKLFQDNHTCESTPTCQMPETPYGECAHYDPEHDKDVITYAFFDGFAREIQTKTPVDLWRGSGLDASILRVSGKTTFDEFWPGNKNQNCHLKRTRARQPLPTTPVLPVYAKPRITTMSWTGCCHSTITMKV